MQIKTKLLFALVTILSSIAIYTYFIKEYPVPEITEEPPEEVIENPKPPPPPVLKYHSEVKRPKPPPEKAPPDTPPDIFIDGQYTRSFAINKCKSLGRELCENSQICKGNTTIFQEKNGGNFDRVQRTWIGDTRFCKGGGPPMYPYRHIGSFSGNWCQSGHRFLKCATPSINDIKIEAFACC